MKNFILFAFVFALASCTNKTKSPVVSVDGMIAKRDSLLALAPPLIDSTKISNSLTVKVESDLTGSWLGPFEVYTEKFTDEDWATYEDKMTLADYSYNYAKINFSIDSLVQNKVFGHSVTKGLIRPFMGEIMKNDTAYIITAKEPGDNKYDGRFEAYIHPNDSVLHGMFIPNDTTLWMKTFEAKKKIFVYDPNQMPESSFFVDIKKSTTKKFEYEDEDGKKGEYEDIAYLTSTEKAILYNASTTLLTEAQVGELTKGDIIITRNTIYARHGFAFKSAALNSFFEECSWYVPCKTQIGQELTDIEIKNIDLLMRFEDHAEAYFDTFGR